MKTHRTVLAHYERQWGKAHALHRDPGRMQKAHPAFAIAEFAPRAARANWTYATCGMSAHPNARLELHIFSNAQAKSLVMLLTAVADFHLTGTPLGLHHAVNFAPHGSLAPRARAALSRSPTSMGRSSRRKRMRRATSSISGSSQ